MRMLLLAVILACVGSGCVVHGHPHGPSRVVVASGHVHDDGCGHYHHGGHWYHAPGHRHGSGCGHHFRGGIWISVP